MDDRQRAEWEAFEKSSLARGLCPYSGERLSTHGEGGPNVLSCPNCDCFGYDPNDEGVVL